MVLYSASADSTAALAAIKPTPVQLNKLQLNTTAIRLPQCIMYEDAAFGNWQIFCITRADCETCHNDWLQLHVCQHKFLKGDLAICSQLSDILQLFRNESCLLSLEKNKAVSDPFFLFDAVDNVESSCAFQ